MLFNGQKKMFLYHLDPLFFQDSTSDGYGDFQGFLNKINYLEDLGVDAIIFPDLFNQEKTILKPPDVSVFNKYGKLVELRQIIEHFKTKQIDFLMEISLKDILNSNMNANLEDKTTQEVLIKKVNLQNQQIDWSNDESTKFLNHIITFWTRRNVHNFIINDFEDLATGKTEWHSALISHLEHIYKAIKKIDPQITICLKSHRLSPHTINLIFKDQIGKICDYFIDNAYGWLCTHKHHPQAILEPFVAKKLFYRLKKIRLDPQLNHHYIIAFDSNQIGRISSRWFDETALHNRAHKTFLLLANFLPYSTITYYGNELGMLRTPIKDLNQYYNFDYNEKKRMLGSLGYPEEVFHKSQRYLSAIHSQSIFSWDNTKFSGFSQAQNLFRHSSLNSQFLNVATESADSHSVLNFYKDLINFIKTNKLVRMFFLNPTVIKIKKVPAQNLFVYQLNQNKEQVQLLINPSNTTYGKRLAKKYHQLLSSYSWKPFRTYQKLKFIKPYESFVYINKIKLKDPV